MLNSNFNDRLNIFFSWRNSARSQGLSPPFFLFTSWQPPSKTPGAVFFSLFVYILNCYYFSILLLIKNNNVKRNVIYTQGKSSPSCASGYNSVYKINLSDQLYFYSSVNRIFPLVIVNCCIFFFSRYSIFWNLED